MYYFKEQICEEAMSFDLTSFDIASCIEDLDKCLDILTNLDEEGISTTFDGQGEGNASKIIACY